MDLLPIVLHTHRWVVHDVGVTQGSRFEKIIFIASSRHSSGKLALFFYGNDKYMADYGVTTLIHVKIPTILPAIAFSPLVQMPHSEISK